MKDKSKTTPEAAERYAIKRMLAMLLMERKAEQWLQKRNTPLQRLVLETARHHVELCEREYGINRDDQRLRSRSRL